MVEAIVADMGNKIMEKVGSAAFKKIKYAKDLDSQIERLREIKSVLAAELHRFDPFEVSTDHEGSKIKRLRRFQDGLVYFFEKHEARAKQKEVMGGSMIAAQARLFFSSSNQLVSPFKIAEKVNAITTELQSIANDCVLFGNIFSNSSGNQNRITSSEETVSFPPTDVFIGRDTDKENIVNMICNSSNDQVSHPVVAIVGVGGQGKTTLAQHVYQENKVKRSFDKQLWVSVTPKSSFNEILEKIIASVTGKKPINWSSEHCRLQVIQAIVGKKCLLVLDNVCYVGNLRFDMEELNAVLKQGDFWGNGGKVLITTRSKAVPKLMDTPKPCKPYELCDLAEDKSWILLQDYAIKKEKEKESGVEEIGKEIANMCPKVPLVLKLIGCHLADKDYKSQWERFRNELASNPTVYMKQQEKIKQILKLCYDQLDNNLKRCVVFCSLFPKGHNYDKNYMVRNWIDLGFVELRDGTSLEDVGDAYVLELTKRALFEEDGTFRFFKMHDVMHDLMQLIGKDEHQMIDSKTKNISEGVRHISLNIQDSNWNVLLSSINGKHTLESILLVSSAWDNRVHGVPLGSGIGSLIPACQKLKVLEIYKQEIEKVPRSIGKLTLVRHLNLSGNPFCKLPKEITKMVNLSTLNLSRCRKLKKLPQKMGNLVNLLSLDLSFCCNLKKLPKYVGRLVNLSSLKLSWCRELEELPRDMGKLVNLLSLDLLGCFKLEELPGDMKKLVKLRHLWAEGCNLRCMPKGFGNLTELVTLDVFVVGENSRSSKANIIGAKWEELGHLKNLEGHLRLQVAGQSKYTVSEAGEAQLEKKTKLTTLEIEFKMRAEEDEQFLEGIQLCGENWQKLSIFNYGGKRLPMWMTDDQFHKSLPKLYYFVLGRTIPMIDPVNRYCDHRELITFTVGDNEDIRCDCIITYCSDREQLKLGTIELSFTTRRGDGLRLTDVGEDVTLKDVGSRIIKEIVPCSGSGCGGQCQPDFLLKCCFPNLTHLVLSNIPELEVVPEEFRDLASLRIWVIMGCGKLKAIPDWIDSLSSLEYLHISKAPKLKVLPDSIGSLTSLRILELEDCRGLELLPHQISNLPESCHLRIS